MQGATEGGTKGLPTSKIKVVIDEAAGEERDAFDTSDAVRAAFRARVRSGVDGWCG